MSSEREKRRAVLRVILGNAQMFAAVIAVVLLWRLGVSRASVIAIAVAGVLLVTSLVLFRVVWRQP
jgi:K+ transporter